MSLRTKYRRLRPRLHAEWALPTLVTAVGIVGLVTGDSGSRPTSPIDLHALFGAVLVSSVASRFHAQMRHLLQPLPAHIQGVSRYLSRMVYLVVGALVLFQKFRGWAGADVRTGHGTDLHDYFAYALIAVVTIRSMAMVYRLRARRHYRTIQ